MFKNYAVLIKQDGFSKRIEVPKYEPYIFVIEHHNNISFPDIEKLSDGVQIQRKIAFKFKEFVDSFTAIYSEVI